MSKFKNFVLVAVLALGGMGGVATEGQAQTPQQYLAQAQAYEQSAASLEARARTSSAALAAQMRAQAQQLRQAAAQLRQLAAGGQARPPAQPQPKPPAFNAAQIALQANQAWLNRARTMRPGRNGGFLIYFSNPPIYQGQTRFTPNARPYFVRPNELFRVMQMLTNNRQRVDNIVAN